MYEASQVYEVLEDVLCTKTDLTCSETLRGVMYYLRVHYPDDDILKMLNRQIMEDDLSNVKLAGEK